MGTGMCIVYAPGTFVHDAEAKAVVQDPTGNSVADIRSAVEACPMAALSVHHHGAGWNPQNSVEWCDHR